MRLWPSPRDLLHLVGCCWLKFEHFEFDPTCCAQQCCDKLFKCCDRFGRGFRFYVHALVITFALWILLDFTFSNRAYTKPNIKHQNALILGPNQMKIYEICDKNVLLPVSCAAPWCCGQTIYHQDVHVPARDEATNEFYVPVARTISHEWAQRTSEILFLPFEHKIHTLFRYGVISSIYFRPVLRGGTHAQ